MNIVVYASARDNDAGVSMILIGRPHNGSVAKAGIHNIVCGNTTNILGWNL